MLYGMHLMNSSQSSSIYVRMNFKRVKVTQTTKNRFATTIFFSYINLNKKKKREITLH